MATVRHVEISNMCDGSYHHFGVERVVRGIIREFQSNGKSTKN